MVTNSTTLGLNFLLRQWWDPDMFSNAYIKVSYAFTIIGFIAESTLKFIDDTGVSSLDVSFHSYLNPVTSADLLL